MAFFNKNADNQDEVRTSLLGSGRIFINFPMLLRVLGWLLMIEAVFMMVPTLTCVIYDEPDLIPFLITTAITLFSGMLMTFGIRTYNTAMGKREGFLLTSMVWIVFSLFGMLPFIFCSCPLSMTDAFFETMSGFTTTGATVYPDVEKLSHGINIWRCLTQWIGGMGIILFTLAVLPMLNSTGGMQMFNAEVTGITHEKLRPRISQTAKGLWGVYALLSLVLCLLLWIGPLNLFDSVCHAFSTMSTGGFSTQNNSIAHWDSDYIKIVVTIFMFLGGVNFSLIYKACHGEGIKTLMKNDTLRTYVNIIALTFFAFVIAIAANGQANSISAVTIDPLFQIITTITSTGLTANNFESWGSFVLALLFVLMFFGACAGSTSGGAKIDRMLYLIKNTSNELYRSVHPNSIRSVRINSMVMSPETVNRVIAFLCIYVIIIALGGIMLTAFGLPLVDSFFSVFSCVSNVGLGVGITGYGGFGFEVLPDIAKWVLSIFMLIGRLELFTVLILFTPAFWRK
ncbi:MAG: TrkH family potassium uptake protein [Muribaculum sp.]|nr:TrkH family potassium uptake protein [Muribaculaceae bacterium]MCM1080971.1 TrkH family potassium uptake protein [Muribaculum sp.]